MTTHTTETTPRTPREESLAIAAQAALVLMKTDRFPTAEQASQAIAQIVKEVDGAELLATLRRRLNSADLPSDLAQSRRGDEP